MTFAHQYYCCRVFSALSADLHHTLCLQEQHESKNYAAVNTTEFRFCLVTIKKILYTTKTDS